MSLAAEGHKKNWNMTYCSIILLNLVKEGRHEFYELSDPERLPYSPPYPVLNFNLSSNLSSPAPTSSQLEVSTTKRISPDQILKEPPPQPEANKSEQAVPEEGKEGGSKESQVEMFTVQQQLINQYMHLNIQLLSKKL